jgi:plasmid maintenance system antidote protein VapI
MHQKHQIKIAEPEMLRDILSEVLKECKTHRMAAQRLGITQPTFTRLLNGIVTKRIRADTYQKIKNALGDGSFEWGLEDFFKLSVLSFLESEVKANYERWMTEEHNRLQRRAGAVFEEVFGHPGYHGLFTRFLGRVTRSPERPQPNETRLWIALYRAVEPLAAAAETWGVERSWQEIDQGGQLKGFLRASLERERIILDREEVIDRIHGREPPDEYLAELAEDWQ